MRASFRLLAKVNIQGIDRLKLLKVLWEQQPPALFYFLEPRAKIPEWNEEEAKDALKYGYIDYFAGRCIKTNLTPDIVESWNYNESRGPTLEDAVNKVKSKD